MSNLKHLKVGDYVYWSVYGKIVLKKIDRITATQVVCGDMRFNAESGRSVGTGEWSTFYANPATEEIITKAKIQRAQDKIRSLVVNENNLSRVIELLDEQAKALKE